MAKCLKSALFMIFKKVRIFDLAKVLCFSNQNAPRQVLFMFDIFRLKPFFSADLGKFFPMNYGFFHTKWPPPTQNPRETLTFGFFTLARSAEVMNFWGFYKALLRLRFVRMSILIGKNRPIQPPNTTAQYNRPLQPPNIATTDESSCTSYFHEKTSSSSLHYWWYS